jgi:hypothetical protein
LQAVKRGQEESDLERIQDVFPNDCLRLYDRDVITMVSGRSQALLLPRASAGLKETGA